MAVADEDDLLACLLDVAEAELNSLNGNSVKIPTNDNNKNRKNVREPPCENTKRSLFDADILFSNDINEKESTLREKKICEEKGKKLSIIYDGNTDSSDEEGNRNFENQKYNECGREIKSLLNHSDTSSGLSSKSDLSKSIFSTNSSQSSSWRAKGDGQKSLTNGPSKLLNSELKKPPTTVYTDPIFGIGIINPVVSSKVLEERMAGRKAVPIFQINKYLKSLKKDEDWVIAGVMCNKGVTKTSAKGNQFMVWTMSDLLGDIKTVALFLFGSAYKQFWKTQPGSVVGILNPAILDKNQSYKDEATLSVDNAQKILILGQSRDLGTCKSKKKNGEKCTAIVNKNKCEFCIYHIKQEYQKCSQRSDLQANFSGKGLIALRNKVLGKNEVFYAGKSYMAIPAKQSRKLVKKDQTRLQSLSGMTTSTVEMKPCIKKSAASFDVTRSQRVKDIETLRKLGICTEKYGNLGAIRDFKASHSSEITMEQSKANAVKVLSKLKEDDFKEKGSNSINIKRKITENNERSPYNNDFNKIRLQKSLDEIVKNDLLDLDMEVNFEKVGEHSNVFLHNEDIEATEKFQDTISSNLLTNSIISISPTNCRASNSESNFTYSSSIDKLTNIEDKIKKLKPISQSGIVEKNKSCIISEIDPKKKNIVRGAFITDKLLDQGTTSIDQNKKSTPVFSNTLIKSTIPSLSNNGSFIDLNNLVIPKPNSRAKLNALKFVQKNGPLTKVDPNSTKGTGLKRSLDIDTANSTENAKKLKKIQENEFLSDRFKKMMELQSKHMNLVEERDNEEKEKYFKKLEVKEQMEEKMTNTYKIGCKAVRCLTCKYTSFSAADRCKAEKHRLRVFDAVKRFFKCGHCGNRIACLDVVPLHPCKNCGGNWERTTMMKEKTVTNTVSLSIRGGEQKYTNSVVTDSNINLLVPDED